MDWFLCCSAKLPSYVVVHSLITY